MPLISILFQLSTSYPEYVQECLTFFCHADENKKLIIPLNLEMHNQNFMSPITSFEHGPNVISLSPSSPSGSVWWTGQINYSAFSHIPDPLSHHVLMTFILIPYLVIWFALTKRSMASLIIGTVFVP